MGPDALRAPVGPLPADPADDAALPEELQALKAEAERRVDRVGDDRAAASCRRRCTRRAPGSRPGSATSTPTTRRSASSPAATTPTSGAGCLRVDPDGVLRRPGDGGSAPTPRSMIVLANPVQPHSEGEIVLASADPIDAPGHPHELLRRPARHERSWSRSCAGRSTSSRTGRSTGTIGPLLIPPALAAKHGHAEGDTPSDALLEDLARHYSLTVYHLTSTCRMGNVVDPRLRVARRRRPARRRRQRHARTWSAATPTRRRS